MFASNPRPAETCRSSMRVAWFGTTVLLLVVSAQGDEAKPTRGSDSSGVADGSVAEIFATLFFGGPGAEHVAATENRLDGILGRKIAVLDFVCELTADQKQKMRL